MRAPDADELLVVGAECLIPRRAGSGEEFAVSPRHVAPVVGPVAAWPGHLLAAVDRRDPGSRQLQERGEAEEPDVAVQELERPRHVVRGKEVRDEMPRAHLAARLEVAVEGDGAAAAEEPPHDAPRKREIAPGVELVPLEPGLENAGVASPHFAEQEESLRELFTGPPTVLFPESMIEVLGRVEPEAVDAGTFRPSDLRLHQEVGDLGQLGLEVRQAGHARRHVVLTAGPGRLRAEPALRLWVRQIAGVVPGMVVNDVEQDPNAAPVARLDERLQLRLGPEPPVHGEEVVSPVTVVSPVRESRSGHETIDVLDDRVDPEGRYAQVGDFVEMLDEPLQVSAVERPL